MATLSRRRVAEFAAEQLHKGESPMKLAKYLAAYLAEGKQLSQAELLLEDINDVLASRYGMVLAEVTSARPLSTELRAAISTLVKTSLDAKSVALDESVDSELIGGMTIKTPRGYFDGSVRKKLRNLQAMQKEI